MSLDERMAEYLAKHRGQWIDGLQLAKVGGAYGWRTRLSSCRREPFNLTIENRQRRVQTLLGPRTVSEYRLP